METRRTIRYLAEFYDKLRTGHFVEVWYDVPFNPEWRDQEISDHLTYLNCSESKLEVLPAAFPVCTFLDCSFNNLRSLPALPLCETLSCQQNQLVSLPLLPKCIDLDCRWNQLTKLPLLNLVGLLHCSENKLTYLPPLPLCRRLVCDKNRLGFLPSLPSIVHSSLIFDGNPLPFATEKGFAARKRRVSRLLTKGFFILLPDSLRSLFGETYPV
jgi:hypothetical protein